MRMKITNLHYEYCWNSHQFMNLYIVTGTKHVITIPQDSILHEWDQTSTHA